MKIFISYRFTGEDHVQLKTVLDGICQGLANAGYENSCSFGNEEMFKTNNFTVKQIMEHALAELDQCDAILAFVNSDSKSEGMLIEVGYALAKGKPIILAKRKGAHTHSLEGVSNKLFEFENYDELFEQIKTLRI